MGVATRREPSSRTGFSGLVVAQFLGAFNDNAFKMLLQLRAADLFGKDAVTEVVVFATMVFTLPFIAFSMNAGYLSDRHRKSTVLNASCAAEAIVLAAGAIAFRFGAPFGVLLGVLFLQAIQSTYYGPGKYAILPEILPRARLARANGVIEMSTFVAIIAGFVAGGALYQTFGPASPGGERLHLAVAILAGLALVETAASFSIPRVPAANPEARFRWNPLEDVRAYGGALRANRVLRLSTAGIVWFWSLGNVLVTVLVPYGKFSMGLGDDSNAIASLNAAAALGIGLGSLAAGFLSGATIELGLVPLGALGLAVFTGLLGGTHGSYALTVSTLLLLGVSAGFFSVPLYALVQAEAPPRERGGIVALGNLLSNVGMLSTSGLLLAFLLVFDLSPQTILVGASLATVGATAYVLWLLPEALGRLLVWLAARTVYRLRIVGRENLPERGGALLVANHVSYVDAFLLTAATHRFIRFLLYKGIADRTAVGRLALAMKAIPITADEGPRSLLRALRSAEDALRAGDLVGLFPEGEISRTGQLLPIRHGVEKLARESGCPIVPAHLDRVWGSVFSFEGGRFFWKRPRRIPYPVTISFGAPLPPTAKVHDVRRAIESLGAEAFRLRRDEWEPLSRAFVREARRRPRRFKMADSSGARLAAGEALARAVGLADLLRDRWGKEERVGILLPPSVAGALVNAAALLAGKIPVHLNYTASADAIRSAAKQCGLEVVVTSRVFLAKRSVEVPATAVFLEDLAGAAGPLRRLAAGLVATYAPRRLLERYCGASRAPVLDDVATIVFSSGSTGDPKGVLLTHANLLANLAALREVFSVDDDDRVLGVLPFFHSFGFLGTVALPLASEVGVAYHPNPLDSPGVGAQAKEHGATILLATPTFLQGYLRHTEPAAFGSLRLVVTGAETLPATLAEAFHARFGIEPLEGYGVTECSPIVSVNVPDHRSRGRHQRGTKRGTVGRPLPGVAVRIVDPESGEDVAPGARGVLHVRGPNVMKGYLGRPDETAAVLRDGWYRTADLATVDEDGFLSIVDRVARFSKIGGEMVPHGAIEDALQRSIGAEERVLAVTGIPDPSRGERLAVVHTLDAARLAVLLERLPSLGLPNLWLPKRAAFFRVEALPILGTGKIDLRHVREIAAAAAGRPEPADERSLGNAELGST